jgi:hypothetical protein
MARILAQAATPETLRRVMVCGCAIALICAGHALPF